MANTTVKTYLDKVEHIFVLVLENRSFDHLFGKSGIEGFDAEALAHGRKDVRTHINGLTGKEVQVDSKGVKHVVSEVHAKLQLTKDPPHEFNDVKLQLCGSRKATYSDATIKLNGFLLPDEKKVTHMDAIACLTPDQLPILTALAKEFAICDNWFSSLPGPTFPNRMFLHAACSAGTPYSPSTGDFVTGNTVGYRFEKGHIFSRLRQKKIAWAIYVDDRKPYYGRLGSKLPVQTFENMSVMMEGVNPTHISKLTTLFKDLANKSRPFPFKYVFIEPQYDCLFGKKDFGRGNSMHPNGNVLNGELLVKEVYEAIRNSPVWGKSALIITFDEHGGFYDHVPPPAAVSPGDKATAACKHFDFKRLGVRVPTIVISPLIPKNVVDHTLYDHTSLIKTVTERFRLAPLTKRSEAANSFSRLFTLPEPRKVDLKLPQIHRSFSDDEEETEPQVATVIEESSKPFILAAAMLEAKIKGPEAWDEIMARARALESASVEEVTAYIEKVAKEAENAPKSFADDVELDAEAAADAMKRYNGDSIAAAWSLGITQAELHDLIDGAGPEDEQVQ